MRRSNQPQEEKLLSDLPITSYLLHHRSQLYKPQFLFLERRHTNWKFILESKLQLPSNYCSNNSHPSALELLVKKFFDLPCCLVGQKMLISAGILLDSEEGIYAAEAKKSLNALALQGSHVIDHFLWANLVSDDAHVPLSLYIKIYIL